MLSFIHVVYLVDTPSTAIAIRGPCLKASASQMTHQLDFLKPVQDGIIDAIVLGVIYWWDLHGDYPCSFGESRDVHLTGMYIEGTLVRAVIFPTAVPLHPLWYSYRCFVIVFAMWVMHDDDVLCRCG